MTYTCKGTQFDTAAHPDADVAPVSQLSKYFLLTVYYMRQYKQIQYHVRFN